MPTEASTEFALSGGEVVLLHEALGRSGWRDAGTQELEVVRVAQLYEVLAGVRVLDPGIGEVLQAQGQLVLRRLAEVQAHGQVVAEIERCAEAFVATAIDRQEHIGSYTGFKEPATLVNAWLPAQHRCDADLRDPR